MTGILPIKKYGHESAVSDFYEYTMVEPRPLQEYIGFTSDEVDTGSFQNDMTSMKSRDDVLTLLIHLGYLAFDEDRKVVFIPNVEIKEEFVRAIKNSLS